MKRMIASVTLIASMLVFAGQIFAAKLDAQTQQALIDAINDEYKAKATYQKVLEKFGDVRPFSNIIKAEEHHIEELLPLFEKYGVPVPEDTWYDKVPEFATLDEALKAGVEAEIENAKMYDEFFKFVKEQDIIDVFTVLRDASQDKHLPAFQRALEGGGGQSRRSTGQGQGQGNGQGQGQSQGNSQGQGNGDGQGNGQGDRQGQGQGNGQSQSKGQKDGNRQGQSNAQVQGREERQQQRLAERNADCDETDRSQGNGNGQGQRRSQG